MSGRTIEPLLRKASEKEKHAGKCVAIYRGRIIDSDRDLDKLMDRLEAKSLLDKAYLWCVPPPGTTFVPATW